MQAEISDELLSQFSQFIARAMGLDYPPARWPDLRRAIAATSKALGYQNFTDCAQRLMSRPLSKQQIEVLANHFTVGETYFFREIRTFEALATEILPSLIRKRRGEDKRLRIWSAACCTGEEPYSIAILLRRMIPDWEDWNLTVLGTDINPHFLRSAEAGIFGEWSFRDAPRWLKQEYFRNTAEGRFEILPEIRQMVQFAQLNLADDAYPSLTNNTNALDVIFCRNVLMYFTPSQARKVLHNLYRAQLDKGWLVVGATELLQLSATPYATRNFSGITLFQKDIERSDQPDLFSGLLSASALNLDLPPMIVNTVVSEPLSRQEISVQETEVCEAPTTSYEDAAALYGQGCYLEAVAKLREMTDMSSEPMGLGLLTRSLANLGQLAEALVCCDQWVATDKLNPSAHYLRAVVLQEHGKIEEAVGALRMAIYINPNFPLAHFAMANFARHRGRMDQANQHLRNAQRLLRDCCPDETLPESDGITAGRLAEIVKTLMNAEVPA